MSHFDCTNNDAVNMPYRRQAFINTSNAFVCRFSEELILFNPLVSPLSKELSIAQLITSGIVAQFLGNVVSFASWSDAWIFKGLSKFLEYHINADGATNEMFISEVLHPTLQRDTFPFEFPFTVDAALSEKVAEKGEEFFEFYFREEGKKVSMSLAVKYFSFYTFRFSAACTFRMIYYAIENEAFSQTLQFFVREK